MRKYLCDFYVPIFSAPSCIITQQEVLYRLPELMETTGAEPNASSCNIIN